MIKKIRKAIESANINFLIGSGTSRPFLEVLNDIEIFLSDPKKTKDEVIEKKKEYFEKVMAGNLEIVGNTFNTTKDEVLTSYKNFYRILNNLLLKRENSILTKQVNVFTTNIDVFSEKALEDTGIEFNDGFHGRFNPGFSLNNFKKSYFRKSLHYENTSEIPVFNIIKLHGSLTWQLNETKDKIFLDCNLAQTKKVKDSLASSFEQEYNKLVIVNPSLDKFQVTLINQYYYDLLRIYSNELEKENSILFVIGFSFGDQHIRDITARVAASNPTLKVYIFSHSTTSDTYENLKNEAKNRNIEVVVPPTGKLYDLANLNSEIFQKLIEYVPVFEDKAIDVDEDPI